MRKRLYGLAGGVAALAVVFAVPGWSQTTAPQATTVQQKLPEKFDLRTVNAVTPIKSQIGGTCWTHGTMAAIESNLLISGRWKKLNMPGVPNMSEYHLDWWNGFNKHQNEDV